MYHTINDVPSRGLRKPLKVSMAIGNHDDLIEARRTSSMLPSRWASDSNVSIQEVRKFNTMWILQWLRMGR